MVNARKVILLRKSSQATGIFMRSISHTAATKVSQSPVLNAAEKESFNCCIFRKKQWRLLIIICSRHHVIKHEISLSNVYTNL